jgi:2-oxoglutarate ferredoxin oxidoreductase subunit alpha
MRRFSSDISIVVGGAAGQGVQTVEALLVAVLKQEGYRVFASKEYMSRIRGGSNSTEIRVGSVQPKSYVRHIDVLLALDQGVLPHLTERIKERTIILGERDRIGHQTKHPVLDVPFVKMATEIGNALFASTLAVGAILGLLGAEFSVYERFLSRHFARKGEAMVKGNLEAAKKGYDFGTHLAYVEGIEVHIKRDHRLNHELLFDGNTALGLGALAAGCDFISSYPMSPGTGVLTYLAQNGKPFGVVVDQAEDEISAINMGIGAWYAGARALVTTSGGGFALMCEGMSLSGMTETPVVVHIGMRPGPATGLPTRTEQGDLNLALYAGHGEFPRALYAPGTLAEAYFTMQHAFEMADKWQVPAVVLSDQFLLDATTTVREKELERMAWEKHIVPAGKDYRRYEVTKNGVSPRAVPGFGDGLVGIDSDEHTEDAHITESAEVRVMMHEKRLRKLKGLRKDALLPTVFGDLKKAKTIMVTWGSNKGVLEEALQKIDDPKLAGLHFSQVYPLPEEVGKWFGRKKIAVLENNATGQFATLLAREYDIKVRTTILQYDGAPFSLEDVTAVGKKLLES